MPILQLSASENNNNKNYNYKEFSDTFFSFTYCRDEETRSWENRQLLSGDTNHGLSWVTLTSHDPIKWYLITPKELRIWKWKWSSSVVSDPLQPHGLYSLPGSSVHGVFQARVLEWFVISWESEWANILFTMKICNKCCHI